MIHQLRKNVMGLVVQTKGLHRDSLLCLLEQPVACRGGSIIGKKHGAQRRIFKA